MRYFLFLLLTSITISIFSEQSLSFDNELKYSQVEFVKLTENQNGSWKIDVTIRHNDTGWDHYADLWVVINPQTDEILASRTLTHPHINEQPFTRSLSNIFIDEKIQYIEVKSKCTLHEFKGKKVLIDFNVLEKTSYKIIKQ